MKGLGLGLVNKFASRVFRGVHRVREEEEFSYLEKSFLCMQGRVRCEVKIWLRVERKRSIIHPSEHSVLERQMLVRSKITCTSSVWHELMISG